MLGPKVSNFHRLYRQDETWQTSLNKAPNKGRKEETKKRGPKSKPKEQTPKWVTMGAQEQIMFQTSPPILPPRNPINHKKHIRKRRGWKTWKNNKPRRALPCNDQKKTHFVFRYYSLKVCCIQSKKYIVNLMTLHSPKELHKLILVFWVLLFIQNINQLLIFLHVVGGHLEKKVNITSAASQASCVFSKVLALHKVPCHFFAHLNSPPDAGVTRTRSLPDVESQRGGM